MKPFLSSFLLASALCLGSAHNTLAQDQPVYGSQLMTEQERIEHRATVRNMKTQQEREAFRLKHHALMQERARQRGVTLPDEPAPRGMGSGQGRRQGAGGGRRGGGGG